MIWNEKQIQSCGILNMAMNKHKYKIGVDVSINEKRSLILSLTHHIICMQLAKFPFPHSLEMAFSQPSNIIFQYGRSNQ